MREMSFSFYSFHTNLQCCNQFCTKEKLRGKNIGVNTLLQKHSQQTTIIVSLDVFHFYAYLCKVRRDFKIWFGEEEISKS